MTPPSAGQVLWKGKDIAGWQPYQIARAGIGFVPEDRRVFADLTVIENLDVARRASQRPGPWTIETVFDFFPKLRELAGRRSGFLSGGEQQMLTIGRTLMCNPDCFCWMSLRKAWRRSWWNPCCNRSPTSSARA